MKDSTIIPFTKFIASGAFASVAVLFFFDFYIVKASETIGNTVSGIGIISGNGLPALAVTTNINVQHLNRLQYFFTGIWALAALISSVTGIYISINETSRKAVAAIVTASVGIVSLLILKYAVTDAYTVNTGMPGIIITFQFAYLTALLAFIVAVIASFTWLLQQKRSIHNKEIKEDKVINSLSFPFFENKN